MKNRTTELILVSNSRKTFEKVIKNKNLSENSRLDFKWARNLHEAKVFSKGEQYRAFLLDEDLLNPENYEKLQHLRKAFPVAPIIIYSEKGKHELEKIIAKGADDIADNKFFDNKNLTKFFNLIRIKRENLHKEKEYQNNLRLIINNMLNGILVVDEGGKIVLANKKARELLGLNNKLLKTKFGVPIVDGEKTEIELVGKGNKIKHFEITSTDISYNRKPHKLISFYDVTERKMREEKIKVNNLLVNKNLKKYAKKTAMAEKKYANLLKYALAGIYVTDINGNFIEANQGLADILGFNSPEELIGRNISELFVDKSLREDFVRKLLNKKEVRNEKFQFKKVSGEKITVLKNSVLLSDPLTEKENILSVIMDVTELNIKNKILGAMPAIGLQVLNSENIEDCANDFLRELGKAAEVNRTYIFYVKEREDGEIIATQKFEWAEEGVEPQISNPELQELNLKDNGFQRWIELLKSGRSIKGNISEFPINEQSILKNQNIKSIIVLPIFVDNVWEGFIGFDSTKVKRYWTMTEENILKTAASLFAEILKRFRLRKELKERITKLREVYNLAKAMPFEYDLQSKKLDISDIFKENIDIENLELIGGIFDYNKIILSAELKRFNRNYPNILKEGGEFEQVFNLKYKAGETKSLLVKGEIYFENGSAKARGITIDLTKLKKAEEKLLIFETVIKKSPAAIIITDVNQKIEFVNKKWEELTGWKFEEVKGKSPSVVKSGKTEKIVYETMAHKIYSGEEWSGEILNRKKNGELFWELLLISPIKNDYNEITHFIGVGLDVTENKKLYQEILESKKKVESADKLKSEFLALITHEFRTPLNAIVNYNYLIAEELENSLSEEINLYIKGAEEATERLINTVNSVILVSEILSGDYKPEIAEINIYKDVLIPIFEQQNKKALSKNIKIKLINTSQNLIVKGDILSLEAMFFALIDNAIKFTREGFIEISVKENEKNNTVVKIRDTGIGMTEEFISTAFNPFSQEDEGFSRSYEGLGLGLAIVKLSSQINNINISIKSRKGWGSEFKIIFPN